MNFSVFAPSVTTSQNSSDLLWFECRSPALFVYITCEIINCVLGLFSNIWVMVLILQDWKTLAVQESFTLSLAMVEIIHCVLSQILILNYVMTSISFMNNYCSLVYIFNFIGRSLFQCGMSVERYMAVVHPVFFLKYRQPRNRVTVVIVHWLFIIFMSTYCFLNLEFYKLCSLFAIIVAIDTFCAVSILRVLRQPGPGTGRKRSDEGSLMKKRASQTVIIIQASVVFNYLPIFIGAVIANYIPIYVYTCVYRPIGFSFGVMGSFVQPFLYLQRSGKLRWTTAGQPVRK